MQAVKHSMQSEQRQIVVFVDCSPAIHPKGGAEKGHPQGQDSADIVHVDIFPPSTAVLNMKISHNWYLQAGGIFNESKCE